MIGKLKDLLRLSGGEWIVSFTTRDDPGQIFDDLKDATVKVPNPNLTHGDGTTFGFRCVM